MVKHKVKYNVKGTHVHVHVFSRDGPDGTWAKNGMLKFRKGEEWDTFRQIMRQSGRTVLEEADV